MPASYRPSFQVVLAAAAVTLTLPTAALAGPELYISSNGDVSIVNIELENRNAVNLFSVRVWGQRWTVPIDRYTTLLSADGKAIAADDIQLGHRLEIKGRADESRPSWIDTRVIRNLSIGTAPPPAPQSAATPTALTPLQPPPAVSRPEPAPSPASVPQPPPPPAAPQSGKRLLTQNLKLGMRGGEVVILQEFLQKNGWGIPDDGPVTGYYGRVTVQAVKKFQTANGLPPEGEVGPKTRAVINEFLKSKTP